MNKTTFTITATMEERWVNHFLTFLKHLEFLGEMGMSRTIAFYSDGDGDFRPKFEFEYPYEEQKAVAWQKEMNVEALYDAG